MEGAPFSAVSRKMLIYGTAVEGEEDTMEDVF